MQLAACSMFADQALRQKALSACVKASEVTIRSEIIDFFIEAQVYFIDSIFLNIELRFYTNENLLYSHYYLDMLKRQSSENCFLAANSREAASVSA
jgi:hypothetical protein